MSAADWTIASCVIAVPVLLMVAALARAAAAPEPDRSEPPATTSAGPAPYVPPPRDQAAVDREFAVITWYLRHPARPDRKEPPS